LLFKNIRIYIKGQYRYINKKTNYMKCIECYQFVIQANSIAIDYVAL